MRDIIYVEHQNYVSVKKESFRFVNLVSKQEQFIPVDDVEWLIFENERSYFSKRIVTVCAERNVGILFFDRKHSPSTLLINSYGHSQKVIRLKQQISLQKKTKNRLWRKIIVSKIMNQADCIKEMTGQVEPSDNLKLIGKSVTEGDPHNREAYAARLYFSYLFGKNFRRGKFDDPVNSGLNYGYALVRALIRRELAFHGLEPSMGIKHDSVENPFNLSDDIIEVYRPFVDAIVYEKIFCNDVYDLDLEQKKELLNIFVEKCVIADKVYTLNDAVRVTVESYLSCLEGNSAAPLKLPSLIEGGK